MGLKRLKKDVGIVNILVIVSALTMFIVGPLMIIERQESEIATLEEENFSQHAEIQELKQTLTMIQARNEGIKYIDELPEGELPWEN